MINHNGYYEIDFEDVRQKWKQKILNYVFLLIRIIQQVVWSEDELKQLGQIMVDNDVWIISDEIHCDIKRRSNTCTFC